MDRSKQATETAVADVMGFIDSVPYISFDTFNIASFKRTGPSTFRATTASKRESVITVRGL